MPWCLSSIRQSTGLTSLQIPELCTCDMIRLHMLTSLFVAILQHSFIFSFLNSRQKVLRMWSLSHVLKWRQEVIELTLNMELDRKSNENKKELHTSYSFVGCYRIILSLPIYNRIQHHVSNQSGTWLLSVLSYMNFSGQVNF